MRSRIRNLKDILWALTLAGLVAGVFRLWYGLGATTNLSDAVPWGLWKILNMVAGVAISTSGFTVGFLVYVLRLERFRPLMKPAILVAFLGYGCSCLALLFDIGLPHRFWHPFVMWNEHSFLFEVFWCVSLYFTVTAIELAPLVFDKLRAEKAARFLHRIAFGVVVLGISLSSLHHSSLGSLFLVTPQRLHPLWYSPLLPLFFILSAIGAGLMFVVLIRFVHAYLYDPDAVFGDNQAERRPLALRQAGDAGNERGKMAGRDMPMLTALASVATLVLGAYLVLQLHGLGGRGSWEALVAGTWESWLFGIEILLTAAIPILLVWLPGTRGLPLPLGLAAFSASAGLALNRMNVGIFGYFRDAGSVYFPSLVEWALSLGVVAAAGLAFLAFVEKCPVFEEGWTERRRAARISCASFDSLSRVWETALSGGLERVTVIAVLVVPLAWAAMYPPFAHDLDPRVRPAAGLDATRTTLLIDGNHSGIRTEFPHADHKERLGGDSSCVNCHHRSLPGDETTPCSRCHRRLLQPTLIFDHRHHHRVVAEEEEIGGLLPENRTCSICHTLGAVKTAETAKSCLECHEEDPGWADAAEDADLARAVSYMQALHTNCIECHEEEGERQDRPTLGDCSTCHSSLKRREEIAPGRIARRSSQSDAGSTGSRDPD
ncbi:MAG: polysulfide reductase NrfD [Gemmatimonadales bacterium]|jgi:Ni/Fe-hydrogenase subunit HybB-like protein